MSPADFEAFVVAVLRSTATSLDNVEVRLHEKIEGVDGVYDFDATVRYSFAGMRFLILVEAKLHRRPIDREYVQVLHEKIRSVGGHKGVIFSTAPYKSGAVRFAQIHGIALVTLTEGRYVYATRSDAIESGVPKFVGHHHLLEHGTTVANIVSVEYPEYVVELFRCTEPVPRD
jgi:restriction endonuclease